MRVMKTVDADVLCIGGGIAGLMAAIRASELGAKVVVVEKGNTLTSGAAGMGNDHFVCYLPEIHGPDMSHVIEELRRGQIGERLKDGEAARVWLGTTADIVTLWESWGIPMKYHGEYVFAGHAFPGDAYPCHLKYGGKYQKRILTAEARKRGVLIINRVMIVDLITEPWICGAVGIHTREDAIWHFQANAVVLGTGTVSRLYPSLTPGWIGNATRPCTTTGDGRAMAYRAGAELRNMEKLAHHAGPKYFTRSGQATWVGVLRDSQGNPVGPYLTKPDARYSDMITEVNKALFDDYARSGRGPVFMDCRGISDEDYAFMMHWFDHEGFRPLMDHLRDKNIDLRRHQIEWATYTMRGSAGSIRQNVKAETSVIGLYAAGDETAGGISSAAVFGWIAGSNAAEYVRGLDRENPSIPAEYIEGKRAFFTELRARQDGPDWKEINIALQQIMSDYAGVSRTEEMLRAGLTHLARLKKEHEKR